MDRDREALLLLPQELCDILTRNGGGWTAKNPDTSKWRGVTVNDEERVAALALSGDKTADLFQGDKLVYVHLVA